MYLIVALVFMRAFVFRHFREIAKRDYLLRHVCLSVRLSGRSSAWNDSPPTGQNFMKFYICGFFENLSRNPKLF